MQTKQLEELRQDLLVLLADMDNERKINALKVAQSPPGAYAYGEGMHDGLRYAAEGLENLLKRHGLLAEDA